MKVVKETEKKVLDKENLDEVIDAIHEAMDAFQTEEYKKSYHLLDMASIGLSMEKVRIIKKDSENEKSN